MAMLLKGIFSAVLVLVTFSSFPLLQGQEVQEAEGFSWKTDLPKALVEANESGKPLLIVFR